MKIFLKTIAFLCVFVALAHALPLHNCAKEGHVYGPWYKQAQMFYIPEQPAHTCKYCGSFQNSLGRYMELVQDWKVGTRDGEPGGLGKLTKAEADKELYAEVAKDFPTPESYRVAPARDGYPSVNELSR